MNWDDVRMFLAVARTGQILAASRRLGVNHATLSRRVTALETALETRLFVRRTHGCDLTSEGEALLAYAERIESDMLAAQGAIGKIDTAIAGTVRIGAPDGFGVSFLAPRLGRLIARHPELTIELVPVPRSFSLSGREADIAVTLERPSEGRLVSSLLTDYTLGLYASAAYLAEAGPVDTVEQLAAHRRIGYVEDLIFSQSLNFSGEFLRDWSPAFSISSAIGQTEAVRSGAGVGILHNYIARHDPGLVRILPERSIRRSYWTIFHESVRELARIRVVADFLHEAVDAERAIFL